MTTRISWLSAFLQSGYNTLSHAIYKLFEKTLGMLFFFRTFAR